MYYVFFALFVALSLCRPEFKAAEPVSGRRYVAPMTVERDFEHGEQKLAYDITLNENVILIDEMKEVEAVRCEAQKTELSFIKGKKIDVKVGDILVGAEEWGCIHPKYNKALPFYRRVLAIEKVDAAHDIMTFKTEIAPLTDLFAQADVKYNKIPAQEASFYNIPKGTVIGQATPVDEPVDLGDYVEGEDERRAESDFTINEFDLVYFPGDTINATFSYNNSKYGASKFEICLKMKRIGFDKTISCTTKTLGSYGKDYVTFPVLSTYQSSNAYYIHFSPKWSLSSWDSSEFGVNPATLILSPVHGNEFYANNEIEVKWYASPEHKSKTVELALIKSATFDKVIKTWQVSLASEKMTIQVNDLPKSASAGNYYFRITYGCAIGSSFCDLKENSDEFALSRSLPGQKSISVTSPIEGDVFLNEQVINIAWTSNSMTSDETVKVSICRESYGFDSCPFKKYTTKNIGKLSVKPKSSWKGSSNYYVLIQYNCKLLWCNSAESKRFAINYKPQFEFTNPTPAAGAVLSAPSSISVGYKLRSDATIAADKRVNVKLMRQVPFLDLVHDNAAATLTAGSGSHTFSITQGTIFPVRFMISYNCKISGYFCDREYSPIFYIPTTYHKGWNDDPVKRIELFSIACGEKCKGLDNPFCKVCNKVPGLTAKIDIACEKCYVSTDVKAYDFTLNVSAMGITAASLNVQGSATANLDVLVQFDAAYKFETEFEIAHYDILGTSFKVGPINIALAARVALNTTLAFGVSGTAKVAAGFDATVGFNAISSYGGVKGDTNNVSFGLTRFNKHDPTIDLRVTVVGEAGIKPVLEINIVDLLRFWVAIRPYLQLTANFQIPPFNPTGYPDENSFGHLGLNCSAVDHYSEYDLRLKIEANMYAKALKKEWKSPIWSLLDKSLVSGCLFAAKGPLDEQVYAITSSVSNLGYTEDSFKIAFMDLLVKHLTNADSNRLELTVTDGDVPNSTNVKVQAFQTEDAHKNIDLNRLTDIIRNTFSDFYAEDLGLQLKGKIAPYKA